MADETIVSSLIAAFAQKLGLTPFQSSDDQVSIVSFDEIDILIAPEVDAMVLSARIGTVPAGRPEMIEALLSGNLFWQDTAGATLSLEPFSRAAIIARRFAVAEISAPEEFEVRLEQFAQAAIAWRRTLDVLGASGGEPDAPPPSQGGLLAKLV